MVSNIAPALCAEMQNATLKGDYATALKIQDRLVRCMTRLSASRALPGPSSASPCWPGQRGGAAALLPVQSEANRAYMKQALIHAGLLNG